MKKRLTMMLVVEVEANIEKKIYSLILAIKGTHGSPPRSTYTPNVAKFVGG